MMKFGAPHIEHSTPKDFLCSYFMGASSVQRRPRRRQSTHKGLSQDIECQSKFLLSIAPRCPSWEVGHISEIVESVGFTDTGHVMEAHLRFKGPFS
ncbi:hypothetical protein AVEN_41723-1 [Araneus ventricosus]|uniref:Uncharacterized protein n=1 Tax=Araneus ventricosus TaxID=182803 RepID=A0A4Y2AD83_ARAVE|nr:hypothetical protein AVEN_41723-1 [Araneus ventricosus]